MCERMEINGVEKLVPKPQGQKELCYPHSSLEPCATTWTEVR